MTNAEVTVPLIIVTGCSAAAVASQASESTPSTVLKKRACGAQIDANAFIAILAPMIHDAAMASLEWGQANAETNSHTPSSTRSR